MFVGIAESTFDRLSVFYLDLWQYINTFFDDTRWSQINAPEKPEFGDRFAVLERSFAALEDEIADPVMSEQIRRDIDSVSTLRDEALDERHQPEAEWFHRAEKLRAYAQELGLRYAEMAAGAKV